MVVNINIIPENILSFLNGNKKVTIVDKRDKIYKINYNTWEELYSLQYCYNNYIVITFYSDKVVLQTENKIETIEYNETLYSSIIEKYKNNADNLDYFIFNNLIEITQLDKLIDYNFNCIYSITNDNLETELTKYILKNDNVIKVTRLKSIHNKLKEEQAINFVLINSGFDSRLLYKFDNENEILENFNVPTDKPIIGVIGNSSINIDYNFIKDVIKNNEQYNFIVINPLNEISFIEKNVYIIKDVDNYSYCCLLNSIKCILLPLKVNTYEESIAQLEYDSIACEIPIIGKNCISNIDYIYNVESYDDIDAIIKDAIEIKEKIVTKKMLKEITNDFKLLTEAINKKKEGVELRVVPKLEHGKVNLVIEEEIFEDVKNNLKKLRIKYNLLVLSKDEKADSLTIKKINNFFTQKSFIIISKNKIDISSHWNAINIVYSENILEELKIIDKSINGLMMYSNYNPKDIVSVKSTTFLNNKGTNYYNGGAERYLVDLHNILALDKKNLIIYQKADFPYLRKYRNVMVIGISDKLDNNNSNYEKIYNIITKDSSKLHIYSAFNECRDYPSHPSIGISHGVFWDNNYNIYNGEYTKELKDIIEGALLCDKLISVDTNTANVFQTIDYKLGNNKTKVIPNYVDLEDFCPRTKKDKSRMVITYPRRLYESRGLYLVLDIIDEVIEKYPNVEFHLVGKGFDDDLKNIKKYTEKYPKNVFCYSKVQEEMNEIYNMTDICLIPTLYSEGTSLSCLEAMASGNIIIATRVGGLTDLIIDKYNGLLIEPNRDNLLESIEYCIENKNKCEEMIKNSLNVAKVFNKKDWIYKWQKLFNEFDMDFESIPLELIEIYVEDINNISNKVYKIIKRNILDNKLVYLKSFTEPEFTYNNCGLLQIIDINEEIISKPNKIYVEKSIVSKIKDKIDKFKKI